ncbi:MAG: urea amidolyase associated protein UAAP1 [Alphaproteobacteria bacterium]
MTTLDQLSPEEYRQRYEALKAKGQDKSRDLSSGASNPAVLPDDLVLHREAIPGGWYWTAQVPRGQTLRIINSGGTGAVSAVLWNADDISERYNAGDTVKIQWTAKLGKGRVLLSDMGRVLASITDDTCGAHDAIAGCSTPFSNQKKYGQQGLRNSRDNFRLAAAKYGMGVKDVPPVITFFAGVGTDDAGGLVWQDRAIQAGDHVDLRAEMNLIVALSNCPHPLDPATDYAPQPVEAVIWQSPPPTPDDLCRTATDEAIRGFENTDPLFV